MHWMLTRLVGGRSNNATSDAVAIVRTAVCNVLAAAIIAVRGIVADAILQIIACRLAVWWTCAASFVGGHGREWEQRENQSVETHTLCV